SFVKHFLNYFSAAFQAKAALPAFRPVTVVRQLAYNTTPIAFCQPLFQTFFKFLQNSFCRFEIERYFIQYSKRFFCARFLILYGVHS
ncbi:MAG: hypothetical protein MR600_10165, partial [Subdoligranulum sp.]|nr:hypothetical protein [Subdoligranulum sp.]